MPTAYGHTARSPVPADWSALARDIAGAVVRPGDPAYEFARLSYNARFDTRPQAVVFVQQESDVQHTLAFARQFGLPLAVRGGGHSYAGWSTSPGITLDMTRMKQVTSNGGTATAGAGALLIDTYDALLARGRCIPGGTCPTIGVAGLTMGGGLGPVSRAYGLTCDQLTAAQVVTADGRLRECSPGDETDLFWALRGGGGGNFGVVTRLSYRTHPVTVVTQADMRWRWADSGRVLDAWQMWAPFQDHKVWSRLLLAAEAREGCSVTVKLVALGDRPGMADSLAEAVGASPVSVSHEVTSYRDMVFSMAGCDSTLSQCHLVGQTPEGTLIRPSFIAASNFVLRRLPPTGIEALTQCVTGVSAGNSYGYIILDSMLGAIGDIPPQATAFPYRSALFSVQYYSEFPPGSPPSLVYTARRWQQAVRRSMTPWTDDSAYVNYVDPYLDSPQRAYYSINYPRLAAIKARYDPRNVFRFPQSV